MSEREFRHDFYILQYNEAKKMAATLLKADYQFKSPLTENYVLQQLRRQFKVESDTKRTENTENAEKNEAKREKTHRN